MAATAIAKAGAGSGNNVKHIKVFASGKLVYEIKLYLDKLDAQAAQDRTDIAVHVSATLRDLEYNTETTIS